MMLDPRTMKMISNITQSFGSVTPLKIIINRKMTHAPNMNRLMTGTIFFIAMLIALLLFLVILGFFILYHIEKETIEQCLSIEPTQSWPEPGPVLVAPHSPVLLEAKARSIEDKSKSLQLIDEGVEADGISKKDKDQGFRNTEEPMPQEASFGSKSMDCTANDASTCHHDLPSPTTFLVVSMGKKNLARRIERMEEQIAIFQQMQMV